MKSTSEAMAELSRKKDALNRLLATKESECRDLRSQRNAIELAIGSLVNDGAGIDRRWSQ